jgi:hypothetical protein
MPVVLTSSGEYTVCLDAPEWSHTGVLAETVFALFYTLRKLVLNVALLVECMKMNETLFVVGLYSHLVGLYSHLVGLSSHRTLGTWSRMVEKTREWGPIEKRSEREMVSQERIKRSVLFQMKSREQTKTSSTH